MESSYAPFISSRIKPKKHRRRHRVSLPSAANATSISISPPSATIPRSFFFRLRRLQRPISDQALSCSRFATTTFLLRESPPIQVKLRLLFHREFVSAVLSPPSVLVSDQDSPEMTSFAICLTGNLRSQPSRELAVNLRRRRRWELSARSPNSMTRFELRPG